MATYEPPWEYSFPPFFTLQRHEDTKRRQIALWADIILKFYRANREKRLNLGNPCPIFKNEAIGREVSPDLILQIIIYLEEADYIHPANKDKTEWYMCWYTLDEYADIISKWVQETGQLNTVCTLFELTSEIPEFQEVDEEILIKALRKLEGRGRAELIELDDSYGVKFF